VMSLVSIDDHDFLSKLSVIKNYLSLILEREKVKSDPELTDSLERVLTTAQELINSIKETARGQNSDR